MEKVAVDRIEDGIVTLEKENLETMEIPVECMPFEVTEGDILLLEGDQFVGKDEEEKQRRIEYHQNLLARIFGDY